MVETSESSPSSSDRKRTRADRRTRQSEAPGSAHVMTTRSRSQSMAQMAAKAAKTRSGATAGSEQRRRASAENGRRNLNDGDSGSDGEDNGSDGDTDGLVLTSKTISRLASEAELSAKLAAVFADPCTLARCFPQTDPVLAQQCPVDVVDVRRGYEIIFERNSEKVLGDLRLLTISAINVLNSEPCDEHSNQTNAILIMLLNPMITEYRLPSNTYLFPELCSSIMGQPPAQRDAFVRHLTAPDGRPTPEDDAASGGEGDESRATPFGRHIAVFQAYIARETTRAARRPLPAPSAAPAPEGVLQKVSLHTLASVQLPVVAQCLALMNSYNDVHHVVPYTAFYNAAVNEHIDIKEDVPRFRMPDGVSFCSYPFLLSPTTKSEIIRIESVILMRTELQDSFFRAMFSGVTCPYLVLEVRRDSLVRDTLYQLDLKMSQDLRKQLKVRFVGEEGVDEGGVQKEFFQLIVRDVFAPKYGIFRANDESQYYWFTPQDEPSKDSLEEMRLTGQLIGLAVYNAVILDIHLPLAIYKKLLGVPVTRDDLREIDPALHHGLMQLLSMTAEELEALDRIFEVEYDNVGEIHSIELIPDGAKTTLTVENREEFIDKYVDFVFNTSCAKQFAEFKAGFERICGASYVRFMRPKELELLVCGCSDLDFAALKSSTIYDGGYTKSTEVIQFFWRVVEEFTDELKRKLLFFATSSDRVPIGGLSKLHFVIAKNGGDSDRLPTSHTCFNVLLLPEYSTVEKLKERVHKINERPAGYMPPLEDRDIELTIGMKFGTGAPDMSDSEKRLQRSNDPGVLPKIIPRSDNEDNLENGQKGKGKHAKGGAGQGGSGKGGSGNDKRGDSQSSAGAGRASAATSHAAAVFAAVVAVAASASAALI
ncbi:hypothetical protein GGI07_003353 [Coemansia sp. Benny D115]|nr:hypothetical protein GGI07_003353 [Coemansia sp. Benny D115]